MRDMLTFAVVFLLLGVTQSRSVQVELLSLIKNVALHSGANDAFFYTARGNEKTGETSETREEGNNKFGFILFGDLKDLEKYQITVNENVENNQKNSENDMFSPYGLKENGKDLVVNPVKYEETENNKKERSNFLLAEKGSKKDQFFLKLEDDYEEDEDSDDYETFDGTEGKGKTAVDIFSEDEYKDYNDKDNSVEEEIPSEEDESEEERFYDEDEKYYEHEKNNFNIKGREEESYVDGMFMEDK